MKEAIVQIGNAFMRCPFKKFLCVNFRDVVVKENLLYPNYSSVHLFEGSYCVVDHNGVRLFKDDTVTFMEVYRESNGVFSYLGCGYVSYLQRKVSYKFEPINQNLIAFAEIGALNAKAYELNSGKFFLHDVFGLRDKDGKIYLTLIFGDGKNQKVGFGVLNEEGCVLDTYEVYNPLFRFYSDDFVVLTCRSTYPGVLLIYDFLQKKLFHCSTLSSMAEHRNPLYPDAYCFVSDNYLPNGVFVHQFLPPRDVSSFSFYFDREDNAVYIGDLRHYSPPASLLLFSDASITNHCNRLPLYVVPKEYGGGFFLKPTEEKLYFRSFRILQKED